MARDGAGVAELALCQPFRGPRTSCVFEDGAHRQVLQSWGEDSHLFIGHLHAQRTRGPSLAGVVSTECYHVCKECLAREANGLQLETRSLEEGQQPPPTALGPLLRLQIFPVA